RGSAASDGTPAPARKCESLQAGRSASSPAKICRISGKLAPVPFDEPLSPRLTDLGTEGPVLPSYTWRRQKYRDRVWLHVVLFVLTVGTTWLVQGWPYAVTILAILGCHEFGHYFACRY